MSGAPTAQWLAPQCYLSSKNNRLSSEVTQYVIRGKVSLDANNDVPMSLDMDINRTGVIATEDPRSVEEKLADISDQLKAYQGNNTPPEIVAVALDIDAALATRNRISVDTMNGWSDELKAYRGNNTPAEIVSIALDIDEIESASILLSSGFFWLAPFLSITYWDRDTEADVTIREQVGLYIIMPPGETHTAGSGTGNLTGYDPTWILQQSALPDGYTAQKGQNVVKSMRDIVRGAGFNRVNIPSKSNTFRKRRSYDPGTSRLEVLNDMAMRIGYYPVYADRQGVISSTYIRNLIKEHPSRTISSNNGDVVDTVTLEQDAERLCNRVVVYKADTNEDDDEDTRIQVVMENRRATSPVSIDNLGIVLGKKIEGSNIDTVAEAKALARKTLEEGASVLTRLSVSTLPDPRFGVRDVVNPVITRDDGTKVARGMWWVDQVTIGFTPQDGAMSWRLNKLEEYEEET